MAMGTSERRATFLSNYSCLLHHMDNQRYLIFIFLVRGARALVAMGVVTDN
jgi:hypothetical protein